MAKSSSIFDLVGQGRPERKAKKKARKKAKKKESERWGTPEEKYRRLCLHALMCRYAYYVKHTSLVPDASYDRLERVILVIENANRAIISNRYSPTFRPGSDNDADYPQSVHFMWKHSDDGELLRRHFKKVMEEAIDFACEAFSITVV